ncbi:hypothetical protein ABEV54_18205 [Peribacillus psychrosaccharolyticus]|uniref:hypothetical protein n=1 Tax=Peribacillus psychrosaccharolyticus TaxID=1407 RepID=UPI003D2A895F
MMVINIWFKSEDLIEDFQNKNKGRCITTSVSKIETIYPQRIIGINENYDYPDILDDYKMQKLKKSVKEKGWTNEGLMGFDLLKFPNGDMVVNGAGNHRAVLSKELSIVEIKANVKRIIYCD